jgi:hypothetical protein|uniref:Uncharacterized protein n=1 Tax=uncultured marine group II/III euryarchaeote KM3_16_D12 TaxID=1457926 RepID=A0A075GJ47_9EURY|nr:hypothetical protein [uncultured marine group II/III euryarchaeote KM3_16_D12]
MGMTLAELTEAIRRHIDREMEKTVAESMAEHALGFFGYYDRIIDNALEPTDRNLFYMFQDYDLLTTESEETTLWDGREWRIHYWKFKAELADKAKVYLEEGPVEEEEVVVNIYDDIPSDIWNRSDDGYEEPLF